MNHTLSTEVMIMRLICFYIVQKFLKKFTEATKLQYIESVLQAYD